MNTSLETIPIPSPESRPDLKVAPAERLVPGWLRGEFPVLLIAVWFGLVAGLLELALLVFRVEVFEGGAFIRSQQFIWMVPVSELALFTVGGLFLGLVARALPRWGQSLVIGLLVTLTCLSLSLLIRGFYSLACVLIALGVARQTTPALIRQWPRLLTLVRRGVPLLLGVVFVLVGAGIGRDLIAKKRALAGRPAAPADALNVVMIVLDTVRADHLSLYGYERDTTPNLARLAKKGVRFDQARSAAPWTLPSHSTMFTGRWPHELEVERHGCLDSTYPTLAEFFRDRGYATSGIVANQFFCGRESGLARGFVDYQDFPVTPGEVIRSSTVGWLLSRVVDRARAGFVSLVTSDVMAGVSLDFQRKEASEVNREFLDWQSQNGKRPFFAFLNYFDAHDPYVVPQGFRKHFGKLPTSRAEAVLLRDWQKMDQKDIGASAVSLASDAYDDCIGSLDQELGRLFDELGRRGVLERTLVIVTADHGEQFGEHGGFRHGVSLYGSEVHVPLLVIAPSGVPVGQTVTAPVSLRNLPATILDLVGWRGKSPFPGKSIASTWNTEGAKENRPACPLLSELGPPIEPTREKPRMLLGGESLTSIVDEGMLYIRHEHGAEELYDLKEDPTETHDLSASATSGPVLARFRQTLSRIVPTPEPTR
jgi:arylsulfatase A-like enzyme